MFSCVSKIASNITQLNTPVANLFSVVGSAPLLCLLGSRLLIGMKDAGARDVNSKSGDGAKSVVSVSQMQFVGPTNPLLELEQSMVSHGTSQS